MIKFEESRMEFAVNDADITAIKFDETTFFEKHFKKLQTSKGIDFLIQDHVRNEFFLIEVKNFRGAEHEPDTKKRLQIGTKESVTFETALKIRDTISCIVGANRSVQEEQIKEFRNILKNESPIKVILLLEAPSEKEALYKILTDDLKKQLSWLNVKTIVMSRDALESSLSWLTIKNLPSI